MGGAASSSRASRKMLQATLRPKKYSEEKYFKEEEK
jgi:hypothetical protein